MNFLRVYSYYSEGEIHQLTSSLEPGPLLSIHYDAFNTGQFERWFTSVSLGYSRNIHKDTEDMDMMLRCQNLFLSLSLNYIYPRYRIKPYAGIGAMFLMTLGDGESYLYRPDNRYDPSKKTFGPLICLGAYYEVNERVSLRLQGDLLYGYYNRMYQQFYNIVYTDNANLTLSCLYTLNR